MSAPSEPAPAVPGPTTLGRPVVSSSALFRGTREVVIRHGAVEYRLRITRADKLILTK